jgi:hypothetical protein
MSHINRTTNPDGSPRPAIPDTAYIANSAHVYGNAQVYGNARVSDTAQVYGNAHVYGNAQVSGNAHVYGHAWVYGNAQVSQCHRLVTGHVAANLTVDLAASIMAQTGLVVQPDGTVIGAKWVNAGNVSGEYTSLYDLGFRYRNGETAEAAEADPNPLMPCSKGLHVSHPTYWTQGDTLIAVRFHLDDVLACQEGKIRVSRLTVLGRIGDG